MACACLFCFFFLMIRRPPRSTLFPYTTIHRQGRAFLHRAEPAAAGTHVAQHHEGGGAVIPAFADVGAGRALADGVQAQALDEPLQVAIVLANGRGRTQPRRAFDLRGNGNQQYPYCTGRAGTLTRAAAFSSRSQFPSAIGRPFTRRSASMRHSGSPATSTSSKPGAAGVDFMMWTSRVTRAVNSSTGMNRATSMARYIWLVRTVLPRKRMPPTSSHMAPPLSTEHRISTIMARPLPL